MVESNNLPESPARPEDEVTRQTGVQDERAEVTSNNEADMRADPEKFGGEAAPDITPEQFQRLIEEGSINVDGRGRVRTSRSGSAQEGMSLRKRRAWYVA